MGFTTHKRLLVIREGILSYYTKFPPDAGGEFFELETLESLPKFSVEVSYVTVEELDQALLDKKKKEYGFKVRHREYSLL